MTLSSALSWLSGALLAALALCGGAESRAGPRLFRPEPVLTIPHDPELYTQGLELREGILYESSGGYGRSTLSMLEPFDGSLLRSVELDASIFAEGLTFHGDTGYLLTWRSGLVFLFDPEDLSLTDTLSITTEGWGICSNGRELITSDGSAMLIYRAPSSMQPLDTVTATLGGVAQPGLNELEWTDLGILANQWGSNRLLLVDPASGEIMAVLDLSALSERGLPGRDVMNGVAELENHRLLITGKLWHSYYVLENPFEALR